MAKGHENLIPIRDTETAKARGKLGGVKSGIAKREKKLLSDTYADLLADEYKINHGKTLKDTVRAIVLKMDASSVSMLKEIREATEGTNVKVDGGIIIKIDNDDNNL